VQEVCASFASATLAFVVAPDTCSASDIDSIVPARRRMAAYEGTYRGQAVRWDDDDVTTHAASLKSFTGDVEEHHMTAMVFFRNILSTAEEDSRSIDQVVEAGLLPVFKRIIDDTDNYRAILLVLWCATNIAR